MTDEEIDEELKRIYPAYRYNENDINVWYGIREGYILGKVKAETNCPTLKQIIKVLEIYDNAFKGFSEYAKKETAGYIEEKWKKNK